MLMQFALHAIIYARNMNEHGTSIEPLGRPSSSPYRHTAKPDETSIACHEGAVPAWLEEELPALYGNIHSTLAHLRIYGGLNDVSNTYVARRHNKLVAAFLFRRDGDAVRVINEGMSIDDEEIERFADYVFSTWRSIHTISFHAVQSNIQRLAFPCQHYACTANIVLPLPVSSDAYVASLGKNMRRNLRRYMEKLTRSFPSFRFEVFEKERINEQHVRDIMNLNRARIAGKNKSYAIDDEEEKIIALVKNTGLVGVASIDGKVAAGAVGYLVGDCYFFKVIAHDPKYNEYSAGILCTYLMICECIARGCKEYNFMWNEYEYKFALGAFSRDLEHVIVYRSRLQFLLHARLALGAAFSRHRHRLFALLDKAGQTEDLSRGTRMAIGLMNGLRNMKRFATKAFRRE